MSSGSMIQPPAHITIPAVASWFDQNDVHELQIQAFPQFFKKQQQQKSSQQNQENIFSFSNKNINLYLYYRNAILTLWRQNSKKYLSPSLCRKYLLGDVSTIMRVYSFLQNWGLINFPSKQHVKGQVMNVQEKMSCYVCENDKCKAFYVTEFQDIFFQVCENCFENDIYPQSIKKAQFRRVLLQNHLNNRTELDKAQLIKMLDIMYSIPNVNSKDKDIWSIIQKEFPQIPKQQLCKAFLKLPLLQNNMNSNIFENNQDVLYIQNLQLRKQIESIEQPSIFQDYENPILGSIAMNYYLWKKNKQQELNNKQNFMEINQMIYENQKTNSRIAYLDRIFTAAQIHAKILAKDQQNKISELTKMLIQVILSKLQLKNLFISQYQKLISTQEQLCKNVAKNCLAQNLKHNLKVVKYKNRQQMGLEQSQQQIQINKKFNGDNNSQFLLNSIQINRNNSNNENSQVNDNFSNGFMNGHNILSQGSPSQINNDDLVNNSIHGGSQNFLNI